jgi:ribosomal protein L3
MPEQNLVCLQGAVPGARGGLLVVRKSVKQTRAQQRAQGTR